MSELDDKLEQAVAVNRYAKGGNADVARVMGGVTVSWLSQVFGMDPSTVKKRLRDCPPLANRKAGYLYDIATASQYLVKPVFDVDEYMKTMKASELPAHLQDTYWSAMNKKQKWEENAGELWRTDKVVAVLGAVFQLVKSSIQLWPETVERAAGLNKEQKKVLLGQCDGLQKEIYEKLLQLPKDSTTTASSDEIAIVEEEDYGHDLI